MQSPEKYLWETVACGRVSSKVTLTPWTLQHNERRDPLSLRHITQDQHDIEQ